MKKRTIFTALVFAMAAYTTTSLTSCSSMEEEGTGYPLKLRTVVETASGIPEEALSKDSPCHVVAYSREKACTSFSYLFEDNAYITGSGQLNWIGEYRYWPGVYTKFIAYWPADARVILSPTGDIISADCALIAISEPLCHFSENPTLVFHSY